MTDLVTAGRTWFALPDLGVLRVAGADARSFLQGQLSNDLQRLAPDRPLLAALNTPQGRVVAILRLVERADGIAAILPAALVAPSIERLRKYVLRARVTLTDESPRLAVLGRLGAIPPPGADTEVHRATPVDGHEESNQITVHTWSGSVTRQLRVGPASALTSATAASSTLSDRWRLAAIESGEPQIYPETSDLFVAQMLNLDLVDGLSFTKGCYTGQEIIARTQHRGRIKRRMFRYRVSGVQTLAHGEQVALDEGRVGRIVECAARSDAETEILAVVPLERPEHAATDASVRSLSVERLPLPYEIPERSG